MSAVPSHPLASAAESFLAAYQGVGLWRDVDAAGFLELVRAEGLDSMLAEMWVETSHAPDALRVSRHVLLSRLRGINQDVSFAADDVLDRVRRFIPEILSGVEERGPLRDVDGIEMSERRIDLALGASAVSWRYSSVAGLVAGLNALLKDAGGAERLVGLRTDGDYYCYALVDPAVEAAMGRTEQFALYEELDPIAGPG